MFIFGGYTGDGLARQISSVQKCSLKLVGELSFDFHWGACGILDEIEAKQIAFLCFEYDGDGKNCKRCIYYFISSNLYFISFDGINLATEASSNFAHKETTLAKLNGTFVAISGYLSGLEVELYEHGNWWMQEDFPETTNFFRFSTVTISSVAYVFGLRKMSYFHFID